ALIRAGRIDEKVELGLCTPDQLQRLYLKFNPNPKAAQAFATQHADKGLSAAQAQDMLLREFGADSKAEPQ
ncbi:MAG TPA: hypothetical protein PLH13_08735, partial [Burkholderiaceae bacterium]|nr:hypothetical protein [Burkholderiaceae bacterium]